MARPPHRIGAHASIAGALDRSADDAIDMGCNTFQIFSRSPRMWKAAPLSLPQIGALKRKRLEHELHPLVIHGNYLLNLAAVDPVTRERSIRAFREEIDRGLAIGAEYLVIHPGSAKGQEREQAVQTLADSFAASVEGIEWGEFEVLLENTAGGGMGLGGEFTELAAIREAILRRVDAPVGYCVDTAHTFEAGWDIRDADGLKQTLSHIDQTIGLDRVKVIHTNDSKTKLGSHHDRHERIGEGYIGKEAFRRILNHPKLRRKAFILETPADPDGSHRTNVNTLKSLIH